MNQPSSSQEIKAAKRGKLQIIAKIWSTDTASLARAKDTSTGEEFLIRNIRGSLVGQGDSLQRGIHRIQAIGQRKFPGIVAIDRVVAAGNDLRIALPVEAGSRTLSEFIESKSTNAPVVAVFRQLAAQIDSLHSQNIVHGDIRPETILLTPGNQAQLVDFATGHVVHQWTAETRVIPQQVAGHFVPLAGLAPEVRGGEPASPQSDQYSLAMSCLAALTQSRLTSPDQSQTMLTQLSGTRWAPLQPLFARALSSDPAARFPSCAALFEELEKALPAVPQRPIPRRPVGVLLCLPLVLILGGKWAYTRYEKGKNDSQVRSQREAALNQALAPYRAAVARPPESIADGRLPADSDLVSTSVIDRWRTALATQTIDDATRRMNQAVSQLQTQLRSSLRRTLSMSTQQGNSYSFAFSEGLGHLASGSGNSPIELTFYGLSTPARELGVVPMRVEVTGPLGPQQRDVRLGPGGDSSARLTIAPTKNGWMPTDRLAFRMTIQHPESQEWLDVSPPSMADVKFGTVAWKSHSPVLVNPGRAASSDNEIPSGISVAEGTRFRITVDEKNRLIAPWEPSTVKLFDAQGMRRYAFEKDLIGIPPEGVIVGSTGGPNRTYTVANPTTGNHGWGALMMKIGNNGGWVLPTLLSMPITASRSGELYFGLNLPVTLQTNSGSQNLLGDKRYWGTQHDGRFDLRIETQDVAFPPGTSPTLQATVRQSLR